MQSLRLEHFQMLEHFHENVLTCSKSVIRTFRTIWNVPLLWDALGVMRIHNNADFQKITQILAEMVSFHKGMSHLKSRPGIWPNLNDFRNTGDAVVNLFALKILFSKKCIVLDTLDGVTHYKVPENVHMSEIFSDITHSRRVLVNLQNSETCTITFIVWHLHSGKCPRKL